MNVQSNWIGLHSAGFMTAGFTHSAFVFGNEGGINKCPIDGNLVPPGALVTFVQKGLQFLEMEANLNNVSILYFFILVFTISIMFICLSRLFKLFIPGFHVYKCWPISVMQTSMKIFRSYNLWILSQKTCMNLRKW